MTISLTDDEVLLQVGAVAASTGPDSRTACAEVLDLVHAVIPYAASSLSAYDPLTGGHRTLASTGYSERALAHLDTWFVERDEAYHYLRRAERKPLRWRDFPFDYADMYSAQEVFQPEGFRDGMTICLSSRDGRYTGNLHISTDDRRVLTDELIPWLADLQRLLGGIADQMRPVGYIIASMDEDDAKAGAAVVLADATVIDVPGRPSGEHLASGSPLARLVAAGLGQRSVHSEFRWRDDLGGWHRIRTRRVPAGMVVTEHAVPLPHGLTPSEMRVLGGMVEGRSNAEIAAVLVVSPHTVGKHVEHILGKLGCSSRTGAAVYAVRSGLVAH